MKSIVSPVAHVNLELLQTFLLVAEQSSFRMAGENSFRSPSAVSAQIRQLEEQLSVALFYQRLISNNGLRCSMGRKANCYDNAAMESFFHTLKVGLVHRERYTTRQMAKSKIFKYIETYYNRQRKHSAIGYKIPMQFDQAA